MRKLAFVLCAALVGLGVSVIQVQPALANGIGDVPPTVIAPASGQLVLYEKSTASTRHVFQRSYNNGWTGWSATTQFGDAPLDINANLSVLSPSSIAAFGILSDTFAWCASAGLPWKSDITSFRTDFRAATPAVLNQRNGTARIVGIAPAGTVVTTVWPVQFNPEGCDILGGFNWFDTNGTSPWAPGIAGTGPGDFLMGVTGIDSKIYWNYNLGGWSAIPGGTGTSGVAVTTWGSGQYDFFVRGIDNALYHTNNPNGPWESLGGGLASGPGCASWAPGRIDCFVIGTDFGVWHRWFDGTQWLGWEGMSTA